jgi:hypothetical protein
MLNTSDNWDDIEEPTYFDTFSKNNQVYVDVPLLVNDITIPNLTEELKTMLKNNTWLVYDDSNRKTFDYSYGKMKANKDYNEWRETYLRPMEKDLDYKTWNKILAGFPPRPEVKKGDKLASYKSWARKGNLIVARKTFFEPVDNLIKVEAVATFDSNGRFYYVLNAEEFSELAIKLAECGLLNINEYFESQKELKGQLKRAFKMISNDSIKDYVRDIFGTLSEAS